MRNKLAKWGNSLAVRIPQSVAAESGVAEGQAVTVTSDRGLIIIAPEIPQISLDELLSKVTKDNIHSETDWGPPVGREIW